MTCCCPAATARCGATWRWSGETGRCVEIPYAKRIPPGANLQQIEIRGLPLNDAFGSWVYWNRVPQAAQSADDVPVLDAGQASP